MPSTPRRSECTRLTGAALLAGLILSGLAARPALGASLPPAPEHHFNDYAGVVPAGTAEELNARLEAFERQTSSQIVVVVFPRMTSGTSLEDYVHQLFQAWQIGQQHRNNGVLLAVFLENHTVRIEVGYGLEGAIPDALAKRIIEEQIVPAFRNRQFAQGLDAAVAALIQAAQGEYRGTGRTAADTRPTRPVIPPLFLFLAFLVLVAIVGRISARRGGTMIDRRGRRYVSGPWVGDGWFGGGSGWGGGFSGGSSGGGGFSGGGFSGGGGSSGGGGASGSW